MNTALNNRINEVLNGPRTTHRLLLTKFQRKVIDVDDFVQELEKSFQYKADRNRFQTFFGYNPKSEIEALIYNYDKRGWLYLEIPSRELFFVDAGKYPYPQRQLDHKRRIETLKSWSNLLGLLFFVVVIIFLIVYFT